MDRLTYRIRRRTYRAPWANWAWHSDTYLKVVAYGNLVVGGIVDGKTRYVLSLVLMNTKKAIEMFRQVYLPAIREHGVSDQFVSDAGSEFKLIHFMHNLLVRLANGMELSANMIKPARVTKSTRNTRMERRWREVYESFGRLVQDFVDFLHGRLGLFEENPLLNGVFSRVMLAPGQICLDELRLSLNNMRVGGNGGSPAKAMQRFPRPAQFDKQLPAGIAEQALDLYNGRGGQCASEEDEDETGLTAKIIDPVRHPALRLLRKRAVMAEYSPYELYCAIFTPQRCDASFEVALEALTLEQNLTLQLQLFEAAVAHGVPDNAAALNVLLCAFRDTATTPVEHWLRSKFCS